MNKDSRPNILQLLKHWDDNQVHMQELDCLRKEFIFKQVLQYQQEARTNAPRHNDICQYQVQFNETTANLLVEKW